MIGMKPVDTTQNQKNDKNNVLTITYVFLIMISDCVYKSLWVSEFQLKRQDSNYTNVSANLLSLSR